MGIAHPDRESQDLAVIVFVVPWLFLANGSLELLRKMLGTLFQLDSRAVRDFWYLGRFPFIEVAVVFLLLWLVCLAWFLERPGWRGALALGGALAVLQYSYFYHATGAAAMTACAVLAAWPSTRRCKLVIVAAATYLVLATPYFLNMAVFLHSASHADYVTNTGRATMGFVGPHLWMFAVLFAALALDYAYLVVARGKKYSVVQHLRLSSLQIGLLAAYAIVMNIQLVLGWTIQPEHWKVTFYLPVLAALMIVYLWRLQRVVTATLGRAGNQWLRAAFAAGGVLIMVAGAGTARTFARQWRPAFAIPATEAQVLEYLGVHAPGLVVFSNSLRMNLMVAGETGNPVLFGYAAASTANQDELVRRFVLGFRAAGYDAGKIRGELKLGEDWIPMIRRWRRAPRESNGALCRDLLTNRCSLVLLGHRRFSVRGLGYRVPLELTRRVEELCSLPLSDPLFSFRLDYVVFDKRIAPPVMEAPSRNVVFQNRDFVITRYQSSSGAVPTMESPQ